MTAIGESIVRVDALGKVTGKTLYPGDIDMPNQVFMKILFSNRPPAIIHDLDVSSAEALPGVVAVLTAKDVPVNEHGLHDTDSPVLCGPGSSKLHADRTRSYGDQIALVVAESEAIAAEAAKLIRVEYEDLPVLVDPVEAMRSDAPLIHPDRESNIFCHYPIRKGNVERGFAESAIVVGGEYRTPAQDHAFLQPEAGLAYVDDEDRVTVVVTGQWAHEDQMQIARALNLPRNQVRVIYTAIGGAYGGREDMTF